MKPKDTINLRGDIPVLDEVILFLLNNERYEFLPKLTETIYQWLTRSSVQLCSNLQTIDFSSLQNQRCDYASQQEISEKSIEMTSAFLLHYGGDVGHLMRYCGNK